jgi:hypothetical protein
LVKFGKRCFYGNDHQIKYRPAKPGRSGGHQKDVSTQRVEITIEEEYDDDEDATTFIMSRPELAEELKRTIESIENKTANPVTVKVEELP